MLKVANSVIDASQIKTPITFVGDVTLSTGNLVIGTAGKGIDFSATSSGSGTMTSELLADYEEGTFTPTITFGGGSTGITYNSQLGVYTKIGRMVYYSLSLVLTSKGSSAGDAFVAGLPFTALNTTGINPDGTARSVTSITFVAPFYAAVIQNTTTAGLLNNNLGAQAFLTDISFSNTSEFAITGAYFV